MGGGAVSVGKVDREQVGITSDEMAMEKRVMSLDQAQAESQGLLQSPASKSHQVGMCCEGTQGS